MKRNKYIKRVASEADKASQKQKTKLHENKNFNFKLYSKRLYIYIVYSIHI